MEEVLDIVRREFASADTYYDEELANYVTVDGGIVEEKFNEFKKLHAYVLNFQDNVKQGFIGIAYSLYLMRKDEIYKAVRQDAHGQVGYNNFYPFCKDVFGFKKATTAYLLKIFEEFCNKESGLLNIEYMNYSYTQLIELASMDRYRERIPCTMSSRNIKRLRELYKEYTPSPGTKVDDDLKEWQRRHDEKKARENAERNAINFVPSQKSDMAVPKTDVQALGHEEIAESDKEDARLLSTPEVKKELSFEQIRNGLLRQLELLQGVIGWKGSATVVINALTENRPMMICRTADVVKLVTENEELKKKITQNSAASGEKLNLKNEKSRREWLDNFRSWGVWRELPEVNKTFYRYDFVNGYSVIVEVGIGYYDRYDGKGCINECERIKYAFLDGKHGKYSTDGESYTYAIKWLTEFGKEI